MKVINLFAGPGAGKSTIAAGLFYYMKTKDYKVELVTEYAKQLVYDDRINALLDQLYVFSKQLRKLRQLENKVDYVITDSPILLSNYFGKNYSHYFSKQLEDLVLHEFANFDNINLFIERTKKYQAYGRLGSEESAKHADKEILQILNDNLLTYFKIKGDWPLEKIFKLISIYT